MKNKDIHLEYIKANRKGSREAELEDGNGFKPNTRVHKSEKAYSRKRKIKILLLDDED